MYFCFFFPPCFSKTSAWKRLINKNVPEQRGCSVASRGRDGEMEYSKAWLLGCFAMLLWEHLWNERVWCGEGGGWWGGGIILQQPEGNLCMCAFFVRLCTAVRSSPTYSVCVPLLFSFGVQRQPFFEMKSASAGLLAQVANAWRMELWWIVPAAVCVSDWISLHGKYTYPLLSCTVPIPFLSEQHWLQLITIIRD